MGLHCWEGFSLVAGSRGLQASHCGGSSSFRALPLGRAGPSSRSQGLERRGSVVVAKGLVAPWQKESFPARIKPKSPTLAGRFLTTEPPGKPLPSYLRVSRPHPWAPRPVIAAPWCLLFDRESRILPKSFLSLNSLQTHPDSASVFPLTLNTLL